MSASIEIMARLRDPVSGCEWDSVQTFATIAPYTIEEAYEVADAIARDDMDALADELGDLQLQVVFHARMAEEAGNFTLDDVLDAHLRQDGTPASAHLRRRRAWRPSSLGGSSRPRSARPTPTRARLPALRLALPALERAAKLQRRAARTGFDWPDAQGPRAKIDEELAELDARPSITRMLEEMGDLLFAVVNLARHLNIEPEAALREANRKFERRFRAIEQSAGLCGPDAG